MTYHSNKAMHAIKNKTSPTAMKNSRIRVMMMSEKKMKKMLKGASSVKS